MSGEVILPVTRYVLDTSALLEAHVRAYPMRTFPGLWRRLSGVIAAGRLMIPEEVLEELGRKDDGCADWAKNNNGFVIPIDEAQQDAVRLILRDYPKLVDDQKGRSQGDPWVIALAKVTEATEVTQEHPAPRRIKIPDVCEGIGIKWINLVRLLDELGFTFQ